jgi:hypothetical protein
VHDDRCSFLDAMRDCARGGDTVAVRTAGLTVTGRVVRVGPDVLGLDTGSMVVDVCLGARAAVWTRVVASSPNDGSSSHARATLRARLLELEEARTHVALGLCDGSTVPSGRLAVGADFVRIDGDASPWLVPLEALAWFAPVEVAFYA